MGLDSLECHRLKRTSGLNFVQTMSRRISNEILQLIVRLWCDGRHKIDLVQITSVTQGTISKILK